MSQQIRKNIPNVTKKLSSSIILKERFFTYNTGLLTSHSILDVTISIFGLLTLYFVYIVGPDTIRFINNENSISDDVAKTVK